MTHYQSAYVTLNEVVQQLDLVDEAAFSTTTTASNRIDAQSTAVKALLKRFIYEVSDDIGKHKHRDFVPYDDTLTIYSGDWRWHRNRNGDYVLDLSRHDNRDLLSVTSITLDGSVVNSSYYRLDTRFGYPAYQIIFDRANVTIPTQSFSASIDIVGTWGYHENPNRMWLNSGSTVADAPLAEDATTLNVATGTGANFEVYQYLKIEDEYLLITDINTDALTVERGVNGSTKASHVATTPIYQYNQTDSVRKEARRLVLREYALRNGVNVVVSGEQIRDIMRGGIHLDIAERYFFGGV